MGIIFAFPGCKGGRDPRLVGFKPMSRIELEIVPVALLGVG